MLKNFFNILIINSSKNRTIKKIKIRWAIFLPALIFIFVLVYFIIKLYYHTIFTNDTLYNIEELNANKESVQKMINSFYATQIDNYIELQYITFMRDYLFNFTTKNEVPFKTLDDKDFEQMALENGLLAVINEQNKVKTNDLVQTKTFQYIQDAKHPQKITPSILPVKGFVVGEFGSNFSQFLEHPDILNGVLINTRKNSTVIATAEGIVTNSGLTKNLGNFIEIYHGFGFITRYYHIEDIQVELGQTVKKEEVIAKTTSKPKDNLSYIYYQVVLYGVPQNPLAYVF